MLAARVATDHGLRYIEDRLGAAVVLLQQDHLGLGVVVLERADIADVGATEGIDALIIIADSKDIAIFGSQLLQQHVLDAIGILILVGQQIAVALLVAIEHLGVLL